MKLHIHAACHAVLSVAAWSTGALGYQNGISGRSELGCSQCHTGSNTGSRPSVVLSGPGSINSGGSSRYTLTISGGPGIVGGLDVSVDGGSVAPLGTGEVLKNGEVTHDFPGGMDSGSISYAFTVTAGTGGSLTLFATGLSSNGDGTIAGDKDMQTSFNVSIAGGHAPPTISQPATASSVSVTGTTAALSVLGADSTEPESGLTYSWTGSSSGSGTVSFSPNGTNAAKDTVASFSATGTYSLVVTVTNSVSETATSTVSVNVIQGITRLEMSPTDPAMTAQGTQAFTASATDQFGAAMSTTGVTWTVSGDGMINASGLFTAGAMSGTATVVATMGGQTASTVVTVTAATTPPTTGTPTVAFDAPAMGATVSGAIDVQVTATDGAGVKWVTFAFDGVAFSVVALPPYAAQYDTKLLSNGAHALSAVAVDKVGVMTNAAIEVQVNNASGAAMSSQTGCNQAAGVAGWAVAGALVALARRRRGSLESRTR